MENEMTRVNAELRSIEVITTEIKMIKKQAEMVVMSAAIEIGNRLKEAKTMMPHGEWGNWLEREFQYSQSTANNYMKVAEEYGTDTLTFFGESNSQALGNLSFTKALKLLVIPPEERESFVKENNVEDLSTRELEQLLKERDEANQRLIRAQEQLKEEERLRTEAEAKAALANQKAADVKDQQETIDKLQAELEAERERVKKEKEKVKKLKENPEIPQSEIDRIKKEQKAEDEQALQKQLQAANEKMNQLTRDKAKAEAEASNAKKRAEEYSNQLKMASPEVAKFKTLFDETQRLLSQLDQIINTIGISDKETAGKLRLAFVAMVKHYSREGS